MANGNIGRSSAEKKQMIDILDQWDLYYPENQEANKEIFGWDKEKGFNPKEKRKAVYDSLMKRKNRKDYASHDELKEGYGLGA